MAFWTMLKKRWSVLYRLILYFVASGLVLYMFPREGKFKYEYRKGEPWGYELLVAPFSFPVYKTERELSAERDSVLKDYAPYYQVDSSGVVTLKQQITARFNSEWQKLRVQDTLVFDSTYAVYLQELNAIIYQVFNEGVLSFAEQNRLNINGTSKIVIINSEFAREVLVNDVLNPRTAYEKY